MYNAVKVTRNFGDRKKELMRDIATVTVKACTFVTSERVKLEEVTTEHLGTCEKVTISKENTTIVNGSGGEDIKSRIQQIKSEIENSTSDYDTEKLQERLAKLSGGVPYIGTGSEVEMKEKKDRVDDSLPNKKQLKKVLYLVVNFDR